MSRIITGNGNIIPPEMDASIRNIVLGTSFGQKLTFTPSQSGYTVDGIAFTYGYVALFKKEGISAGQNGYIYVDFTVHYDEDVQDETNVYFSDTAKISGDNISEGAGTYTLLVAVITNGTLAKRNEKTQPERALYSRLAQVVIGAIASNATATTQPTSDNTTKVATTQFVKNVINASAYDGQVGSIDSHLNVTKNECHRRLNLVGVSLELNSPNDFPAATLSISTIGTLPENYRPQSSVSVPYLYKIVEINQSTTIYSGTATINTDGTIVISNPIYRYGEYVYIYCSYLIS